VSGPSFVPTVIAALHPSNTSGLSKGIGVLFSGGLGILCRFFLLGVSPALNTSISSRVNFCVDDGCVRERFFLVDKRATN